MRAVTRPRISFVPSQTGRNRSFEKKHSPHVKTAADEPEVFLSDTSGFQLQRLLYDKRTAAEMLSISLRVAELFAKQGADSLPSILEATSSFLMGSLCGLLTATIPSRLLASDQLLKCIQLMGGCQMGISGRHRYRLVPH